MKYFLICDFSTISCDRENMAKILAENDITFANINNFCWELNVPETFGNPLCDTTAESIHCLFYQYTHKNSLLLVVKANEYFPNGD